jgi:NAD(P)-dependent dehydrogenase (short-subunit alcohol dehydrogenase family)
VAFNNAGTVGTLGPTTEMATSDWEDTIRTNLTSAFLAAKYQIPAMVTRGGGSLIFTSTFVGYTVGFPNMAAYAASKSGLIGLTQALAVEFAARGVRVNALLPGGTDTPMGRTVASTPEALAFVRGLHAMKRVASSEEIAQSALYLASDASSFSTGTALLVDGGVSINRS